MGTLYKLDRLVGRALKAASVSGSSIVVVTGWVVGATFWKPSNARQAKASEQTETSGQTSQKALARVGFQIDTATKPE